MCLLRYQLPEHFVFNSGPEIQKDQKRSASQAKYSRP